MFTDYSGGIGVNFFDEPFTITIDYFILLFTFGIALQLYKKYTRTLWMNIIYHIVYLEVARYISMGGMLKSAVRLNAIKNRNGGRFN